MKVLAYQRHGSTKLEKFDIPSGYENRIQAAVNALDATHKPLKIKDLSLRWDECKGIMDSVEFDNLTSLFETKIHGDGYASFLELGKALKDKQSLERWKKHVS